MASNFDGNVSHYSVEELTAIAGIDKLEPAQIKERTDKLIQKFKTTKPEVSVFFRDIQKRLLKEGLENLSDGVHEDDSIINSWYKNEALEQTDEAQRNKITDRKQKISVFDDVHLPMKREQLGVNDTFQLPVKQDSLNPNLKNTITRLINLDSQFRQYTSGIESSSTDYTLDLSDTLKDVLSIRLYSYQIPYNWYAIDALYGNTCFWISHTNGTVYNIPVVIPSGNYSASEFVVALNNAFVSAGFVFTPDPPVRYNANNGKITMMLNGGVSTNFTIDATTLITFYDFTGNLQCNSVCTSKSNNYFNNTLGWIMGYRVPYLNVDPSGNAAPAILNLTGSKYLILSIDDYNQNHVNNGLVSITQLSNTLKMPNYYSPDQPYTCLNPPNSNLSTIVSNSSNNGLLIAGKLEYDHAPTQIILPSAPRTLTQSQIYTINEINKNKNNNTNYLSKAPTTPDILAIVPVKTAGTSTGELLTEFSGSLQDNVRTYFGPVNIDRMCVKLLDDKGNVVNLNGTDWCITLICECLYQY
jgi:hypothetical protein